MAEAKRCSRCILPGTYPGITFDGDGTCSRCHVWDSHWKSWSPGGEELLEKTLKPLRGITKPYDCILGLSGGKDSAYAAYLCVKHGMTPLAVTYGNGFLTDWAMENIEKTVKTLGLAHVFVRPSWDKLKPWYRNCLLKASEFCSACNLGINAALLRTAKAYGIRVIASGTSPRTEAASPPEFFTSTTYYFRNVSQGAFTKRDIDDFIYIGRLRKGLMHVTGASRRVQMARYVEWKENELTKVLSEELGWQGSLWSQHTDCKVSDAKEYLNLCKHGIAEKTAKLSALVRDGQLTREKAIELAEDYEAELRRRGPELKEQLRDVFDLTEEQLETVLRGNHLAYCSVRTDAMMSWLKKRFFK
ncbi:MAG: N-acetyl sugar amidotransferase [Planctomycetes bacterium]|nr:N-acetyl sugar amidotransferase [Planctomycetota bacterium]